MDLFEQAHQERLTKDAPLAARMRPRTLDDFVGQAHIVGPGRLLRRSIQADQLGSLIFYGPPGTGKTTLAEVIANTTKAHFIALNAVLSGVKDIRSAIEEAQRRSKLYRQRTTLFVDEVHRFNKAQQDALLPWVENGTVIFIGATTENPYFEVNKALVSRSRIFQLKPLESIHLYDIARRALADSARGYGQLNTEIDDDALDHLVNVANGDARALLNALELAVVTTGTDQSARIHITLEIAEESIQRRAVLYDKEGDYHFDTISAFIKSLRGSDPDAALYWVAKMLYAGEAPRFIFRRMLIFASEDIGMADPNAVQVVVACAEAFERMGLPEGRFPLAQSVLYLATAPRSNTSLSLFDALETVKQEADSGVPNHLRDASRDKKGFGHGEGYLYPHAYRDHWVAQQYLPTSLQGKVFYNPSDQGYEKEIRSEVARRREAQLAAMLEAEREMGSRSMVEMLTFSPEDAAKERWLQRTISNAGSRLGDLRDRVLDAANLARHATLLDLKAASGLLTWEAVRRVPEGGVYALAHGEQDADTLQKIAERMPDVERPTLWQGDLDALPALIGHGADSSRDAHLCFDAIVGYNALLSHPDKGAIIQQLGDFLTVDGTISLAERIPRHTQRLYELVDLSQMDPALVVRMMQAEDAIYHDPNDPLVNWDVDHWVAWWEAAERVEAKVTVEEESSEVQVTEAVLARWFARSGNRRLSYGQRLASHLSMAEIGQIQKIFEQQLTGQVVGWRGRVLYCIIRQK